ncbi:MAG: TetR family transcriptional regulator [Deltaproteobacteria bacterium]|nr:TetR family transcriptional regulator [Deltaproteobacteria bacterium]
MSGEAPASAETSESAETGLRDRNRRDRREALVVAAYELFEQRGYGATTMDDVASRAGLSRRTAFRYFATKEELVFPERDERLAALRELLVPREGETAFETVRRASLTFARRYEGEREQMLRQHRVVSAEPSLLGREQILDRAFEDLIEEAFARGTRDGSGRARRRARVRAAAVVGAIRATLREWLDGGATSDLVRLGRETFAELESGFGDEP